MDGNGRKWSVLVKWTPDNGLARVFYQLCPVEQHASPGVPLFFSLNCGVCMDGADPVMEKVRAAFEKSGLSMAELGRRMGYEGDTAKKSVWQFLNRTSDPRISMLRKFADAVGVKLSKLVGD